MGRIVRRLALVCALSGTLALASAIEVEPFTPPSARLGGMGGSHIALADDFDILFVNPAGFVEVPDSFSFSSITAELRGPALNAIALASQYSGSGVLDLSSLSTGNELYVSVDMAGPLAIGWVGRGLGLGFFNRSYLKAESLTGTVNAVAREDIVAIGGYSLSLLSSGTQRLEIGLAGKGFVRMEAEYSMPLTDVSALFGNILARPLNVIGGIGLDAGVFYRSGDGFSFAVVCRDAYSPAFISRYASGDAFASGSAALSYDEALVRAKLDIGAVIRPNFSFIREYLSSCVFALDYHDLLSLASGGDPFLPLSLGMELVVLDVLSLRAGVAEALPSFGLGLDLSAARVDFSIAWTRTGGQQTKPALNINAGVALHY